MANQKIDQTIEQPTKNLPKEQKIRKRTVSETAGRWEKFLQSSGFYNGYGGITLNAGSVFTNDPYLLNQRIKQLKTRPAFMERDKIEEALTNPNDSELALRTATQSMLYLTYPLYRLQMLYEGILTYHNYAYPVYVDKEDMNKPRFKSDAKFVDMWLKKLDAKRQFRRITGEVIGEGKRAYYLRQSYDSTTGKEDVNYVYFESLPSDWYKIIKHSTDSYEVVAFNFAYFWNAGVSLGQFPPIFSKYYDELMNITSEKNGVKSIDVLKAPKDVVIEYNKEKATWFYWKELPSNECFVFSFTETDDLQISPFASLLLQAQDLGSYSLLQQQLLSVPLYSLLLGEIPLSEFNKSGSHLDDFALSPDSVNMFEMKVNSTMPPGTTYSMVPSQKNQLYHFQEIPNSNEIYNKGLQQLLNTSGASSLITTTEKPSVAQVNAGKIIETRYIDRIYDQFAWAVNIIFRDMYDIGDLKYKWHFKIFGDSFSDKERRDSLEKSLSLGQTHAMLDYLAIDNKTLYDSISISDWVDSTELYKNFKPLINTFGLNSVEQDNGRTQKNENEIDNDSTASSFDNGTNKIENR